MHHFDLGWDDTIKKVMQMYLNESGTFEWRDDYAPGSTSTQPSGLLDRSLDAIDALRKRGGPERLVLTTWSYLISMYVDCPPHAGFPCPNAARVARMEAAIRRGDITWHANPLNSEDEIYDAATIAAAIDVSNALNVRYGRPNSTNFGQEDDPGGTRGIIPILAAKGVKGFYVGYNDGSMNLSPLTDAPSSLQTIVHDNGAHTELFAWRSLDQASNTEIFSLFHTSGHGGCNTAYPGLVFDTLATNTLVLPGSDIAISVRGSDDVPPSHGPSQIWCDNDSGAKCNSFDGLEPTPNTSRRGTPVDAIVHDFKLLASWFPNAKIQASTFDAYYEDLAASKQVAALPTFTGEIGDTWIYGVASDPMKMAAVRAIGRAHGRYLQSPGARDTANDSHYANFSRFFTKNAEETWGQKTLCGSFGDNSKDPAWCRRDKWNQSADCNPISETSWREQRQWGVDYPRAALGDAHPLAEEVDKEMELLLYMLR